MQLKLQRSQASGESCGRHRASSLHDRRAASHHRCVPRVRVDTFCGHSRFEYPVSVAALRMSTSIAILKVLSSYPEGRASVAALNADLQMLASPEWFARMRALGVRGGAVNLFSAKLVTRDGAGWTITDAGRNFIEQLESGEDFMTRPTLRLVSSSDGVRTSKAASEHVPDVPLILIA